MMIHYISSDTELESENGNVVNKTTIVAVPVSEVCIIAFRQPADRNNKCYRFLVS